MWLIKIAYVGEHSINGFEEFYCQAYHNMGDHYRFVDCSYSRFGPNPNDADEIIVERRNMLAIKVKSKGANED